MTSSEVRSVWETTSNPPDVSSVQPGSVPDFLQEVIDVIAMKRKRILQQAGN